LMTVNDNMYKVHFNQLSEHILRRAIYTLLATAPKAELENSNSPAAQLLNQSGLFSTLEIARIKKLIGKQSFISRLFFNPEKFEVELRKLQAKDEDYTQTVTTAFTGKESTSKNPLFENESELDVPTKYNDLEPMDTHSGDEDSNDTSSYMEVSSTDESDHDSRLNVFSQDPDDKTNVQLALSQKDKHHALHHLDDESDDHDEDAAANWKASAPVSWAGLSRTGPITRYNPKLFMHTTSPKMPDLSQKSTADNKGLSRNRNK
ncbi:MAG: hypothetical protein V4490_02385, partial [Pseudomonadota bacterium]